MTRAMERGTAAALAGDLMLDFAKITGLAPAGPAPKRYLWTDAFAVCNYLELFQDSGDAEYRNIALELVDEVHHVLGKHRSDDGERGWISGLDEYEGERHPTAGGLRIGKPLPERLPGEPADPQREWEQDGQYYHYLTKWMHALSRVAAATGDPQYLRWAVELAKAVHPAFIYSPRGGRKRMYWKMSIDLSRPQVASMGQHDPLDGLVTYSEIASRARKLGVRTDLDGEIADMAGIVREGRLLTDDSLGAGGLLSDAWRIVQLTAAGGLDRPGLLEKVLGSAPLSVQFIAESDLLGLPAAHRLAFRELGLAIGLKGMERVKDCMSMKPGLFSRDAAHSAEALNAFLPLAGAIDRFWTDGRNWTVSTWREHREINMVMLATSLVPGEFLRA